MVLRGEKGGGGGVQFELFRRKGKGEALRRKRWDRGKANADSSGDQSEGT